MLVTYTPEDGDRQEWTFLPGKLKLSVGEVIEKRAGVPLREFTGQVLSGNARALRVLVWFLQWRAHSNLRFEDVDPAFDEVAVSPDRQERQNLREAVSGPKLPPDVTPEQAAALIAYLDEEDAKEDGAPAVDAAADPAEGKDEAPTGA